MPRRIGTGPVFAFECLMASRRWQVYAGRSFLVAALLCALVLIWYALVAFREFRSIREFAAVGREFYLAMMSVELVLVLLVAPAAAAGAVCQDRARGGLTHLLVTGLSDAEIVLGKLAARLVMVLGIVACGSPVLALSTLLGGVDPLEIAGASMVIAGCGVLGISVALGFSVWATRAHEALTATYAVWAIWLLALLVWTELGPGWSSAGVLTGTNPFWVIFADRRSGDVLGSGAWFLAGCLAVSVSLAALATWRLRPVTLRRAGAAGRSRTRLSWPERPGSDAALLDRDPVLWRERHRRRPSAWTRAIWWLYATLSTLFTLVSFSEHDAAPGTNAFQVSIGLLLVSVSAATALAEERAQGSLDVVLATPLSTREIVRGKWRGAYRVVPRLAILPTLLAFMAALPRDGLAVGLAAAILLCGMVLAYGAVIVGFGLLSAIWQPRLGRAVALSVTAYLAATLVWPTVILFTGANPEGKGFALFGVSPFFGVFFATAWVVWRRTATGDDWIPGCLALLAATGAAAAALSGLARASFDRSVGRVADTVVRAPRGDDQVRGGDRRVARPVDAA